MAKVKKSPADVHLELLYRISDHIQQTSSSIASLDKKVDLHIQRTELELEKISAQDAIQNRLLDEHIEGVNTLRKLYEDHEKVDVQRFADLTAPRQWVESTIKLIIVIGSIAGAIVASAKLLDIF